MTMLDLQHRTYLSLLPNLVAAIAGAASGLSHSRAIMAAVNQLMEQTRATDFPHTQVEELLLDAAQHFTLGSEAHQVLVVAAFNVRRQRAATYTASGPDIIQKAEGILESLRNPALHLERAFMQYSLGVLHHERGEYGAAWGYHTSAANTYEKLGDTQRSAISRFLAHVANVQVSLHENSPQWPERYEVFRLAWGAAESLLPGHTWQLNVCVHAMFVAVWADDFGNYSDYHRHRELIATLDTHGYWHDFMAAIAAYRENSDRTFLKLNISKARSERQGDVHTTIGLMLARWIANTGNATQAAMAYQDVVDHSGPLGHLAKAIAARELAALKAKQ